MKKYSIFFFLAFLTLILTSSKSENEYYNELYRPQFHFSPEKNWQSNPCGLVYYEGEYHLFYESNPKGLEWGYLHWGHAVSTDLVHWEHLPVAIDPDNNSEDIKMCTSFSGSAIVDDTNLLKLQKGDEKTLVIFYTSYGCGQRIAFSNDKGRTWAKYTGNPVIPFDEKDEAHDPKVFWHQQSRKWIMVLWRMPEGDKKKQGISIYNSDNLISWELKSHIPGFLESPDLVELRVNNHPDDTKWILFDGDGSYLIGSFNGETYTPETGKLKGDFGNNYFATQTWSNLPSKDGRTLQIAWLKDANFPDMPFNGQMSFPCELSIIKSGNGMRLLRKPVEEVNILHGKAEHWLKRNVIPGINDNILKKIKGDCFHIVGTFDLKTCDNFGFLFRNGKKTVGIELAYDVKRGVLTCLGKTAPLMAVDNRINLEILMDRSSLEVFANHGQVVMTFGITPVKANLDMSLATAGGELMVEKLDVFEMKSAWREKN